MGRATGCVLTRFCEKCAKNQQDHGESSEEGRFQAQGREAQGVEAPLEAQGVEEVEAQEGVEEEGRLPQEDVAPPPSQVEEGR